MIEVVVDSRCTACGACVAVCPTNVFDLSPTGRPSIARQSDCQTCFMCELYCPVDALYVHPDCDHPVPVDAQALLASGLLGQYRRDSGWGEWADDPRYANAHWRMEGIFARARAAAAGGPSAPDSTAKVP
jgi:NAD-dependent dihydropyrimidine dehydrogenase PreA subunit